VDANNSWRFCAVGNITAQHTDGDGQVYYGTKAFSDGTKVYIDDRTYLLNGESVSVIGLNRFGRYAVESVPVNLIKNVRVQRIFKPTVLKMMDHLEIMEGWPWRGRTAEDRKALHAFVKTWNMQVSETM
jgi:hypothetical protein